MTERDFTRPTTGFWQDLHDDWPGGAPPEPPFRFGYPVRLPCGRVLVLPLRALPERGRAVASLIANQAAFTVNEAIAGHMAEQAGDARGEVVVGMPTLGLVYAPLVAHLVGHTNYVPLGYSRKFWYADELSESVSSITSPGNGKRVFIDPNMMQRLQGRRVVLVDDAISSGRTAIAAWRLLTRLGFDVGAIVVAMLQTNRWEAALGEVDTELPTKVRGVFAAPFFTLNDDGWRPEDKTMPRLQAGADTTPCI